MTVDLVVSGVLRQHHVGVGIVAGEMQLVVEQPPGSYVTMAGHSEPIPMGIDEQGIEGTEDQCGDEGEPSLRLIAQGKDIKGILHKGAKLQKLFVPKTT